LETTETTVTRVEIKRYIDPAFSNGSAKREDLIACAERAEAPAAVLAALERLRRRSYPELRSIWAELGDIPVKPT
jgi:hypothetical protein